MTLAGLLEALTPSSGAGGTCRSPRSRAPLTRIWSCRPPSTIPPSSRSICRKKQEQNKHAQRCCDHSLQTVVLYNRRARYVATSTQKKGHLPRVGRRRSGFRVHTMKIQEDTCHEDRSSGSVVVASHLTTDHSAFVLVSPLFHNPLKMPE